MRLSRVLHAWGHRRQSPPHGHGSMLQAMRGRTSRDAVAQVVGGRGVAAGAPVASGAVSALLAVGLADLASRTPVERGGTGCGPGAQGCLVAGHRADLGGPGASSAVGARANQVAASGAAGRAGGAAGRPGQQGWKESAGSSACGPCPTCATPTAQGKQLATCKTPLTRECMSRSRRRLSPGRCRQGTQCTGWC